MTRCRFSLSISREQCLQYYRGAASLVSVTSDTGLRIAFPVAELRKHMTPEGVEGHFEIVFDADHKLRQLKKL